VHEAVDNVLDISSSRYFIRLRTQCLLKRRSSVQSPLPILRLIFWPAT
jgi:hypothetical protein